jgi:hypothetical protein
VQRNILVSDPVQCGEIYSTIMNMGAFVSPMIRVALAGSIGLGPMLIASGILAVPGSTSFRIWPVRIEKA